MTYRVTELQPPACGHTSMSKKNKKIVHKLSNLKRPSVSTPETEHNSSATSNLGFCQNFKGPPTPPRTLNKKVPNEYILPLPVHYLRSDSFFGSYEVPLYDGCWRIVQVGGPDG